MHTSSVLKSPHVLLEATTCPSIVGKTTFSGDHFHPNPKSCSSALSFPLSQVCGMYIRVLWDLEVSIPRMRFISAQNQAKTLFNLHVGHQNNGLRIHALLLCIFYSY